MPASMKPRRTFPRSTASIFVVAGTLALDALDGRAEVLRGLRSRLDLSARRAGVKALERTEVLGGEVWLVVTPLTLKFGANCLRADGVLAETHRAGTGDEGN